MEQILLWIGFLIDGERDKVIEIFGSELSDYLELSEDDLTEEIKTLGNRRTASERLHFGLKRAQKLKGVLHWIHDHDRINEDRDISISDQLSFCKEIEVSLRRAKIRKEGTKARRIGRAVLKQQCQVN